LISCRALGNLDSSSGGTVLLPACCFVDVDDRPARKRGIFLFLFLLFGVLDTADRCFSGLKLSFRESVPEI